MILRCVGVLVVPCINEDCNVFNYKNKQYKERIKELQYLETLGTVIQIN
jgi:hypothetical protein